MILGLSFYPNKNTKIIVILLTIFCAIRTLDVSRDTGAYYELFSTTIDYNDVITNLKSGVTVEYWFRIASFAANYVNLHYNIFLFIIALVSISIHFWQFKRYSLYFPVTTVAYLSSYYLMHEMIQIRAGLAAAVYLTAVPYLNISKMKYFTICSLATLIHTSFIITFPIYLFINKSTKRLNLLISLALILFFIELLNIKSFRFTSIYNYLSWVEFVSDYVFLKLTAYSIPGEDAEKIGLINISRIIIATIAVYLINKNKIKDFIIIKYFQLYVVGIIAYYILFDYGVSSRISDIFFVVEPLVMSFLFYMLLNSSIIDVNFNPITKISLILLFMVYFFMIFWSNLQIFNVYQTILSD
jgi:hypothetical protein